METDIPLNFGIAIISEPSNRCGFAPKIFVFHALLRNCMSWISETRKLEYKHIWLCISFFLGTVAPGFLTIFHFKPELVDRYDIFKLLIFSLALTLPLLPINAVTTAFLYDRLPDDYENETAKNVDITKGALSLNAVVSYLSLLICYFGSLNFRHFFWIIVVSEIVMLLGSALIRLALKAEKK